MITSPASKIWGKGRARGFEGEDRADASQRHVGDQRLEVLAVGRLRSRPSEIRSKVWRLADSRAARCGASGRAAGGAAVATRLAVGPPARAHRRDEPDAFPSSSIMPSVLRGCVRAPPRAPRVGQGVRTPCSRCRCRSRPAIGVRFTGARASRCSADAKSGSQPAARSAASTAASRPMPDGMSRRAMPAQGPAHGPGSPTRR